MTDLTLPQSTGAAEHISRDLYWRQPIHIFATVHTMVLQPTHNCTRKITHTLALDLVGKTDDKGKYKSSGNCCR